MDNEIIQIFKKVNAIITDSHIVYTSGKHGSVYINKDALYPHVKEISRVGEMFAEKFKNFDIDIVAGPALGGIILSTWTAFHMSRIKNREILGVYTEKDANDNQVFTRGYDKLVTGKNVLIVEDIINTGGSIKKVVDSVNAIGGKVIATSVMINRDPVNVNSDFVGAPFEPLGVIEAEAFPASECELCRKNIPINTDVGHGKKYLDSKTSTDL